MSETTDLREDYIIADEESRVFAENARHCNILLSAAAGSGKTTTLVKRIVNRIIYDEETVNIDRLLVVTFTNAAAAELRQRIDAELTKAFDEAVRAGDNAAAENAYRQKLLLPKAVIGTIDSFCLDVVKKNFVTAGIDPVFRIDGKEVEIIVAETADNVLEKHYAEPESEAYLVLRALADIFCGVHSDEELKEKLLLPIYNYAVNFEEPEQWLKRVAENYGGDTEQSGCYADSCVTDVWYGYINNALVDVCEDIVSHIDMLIAAMAGEGDNGDAAYFKSLAEFSKYAELLNKDRALYANTLEALKNESAKALFEYDFNFKTDDFVRITKSVKDDFERSCAHKALAAERKKYNTYYTAACKKLLPWRETYESNGKKKETLPNCEELEKVFCDGVASVGRYVKVLCGIVAEIFVNAREMMRSRCVFSFSEIAHTAYGILQDENAAASYRAVFDEIYIDEYQDTSALQERILRRVSRIDAGENNMFMVGDVKQSIYGFRYAKPDYFIEKYKLYSEQPDKGELRILSRNFRSRKPVLDAVNSVFAEIMKKGVCEIEYTRDVYLNYGAIQQYEERPLVDVNKGKAELHIAQNLPRKIEEGNEQSFLFRKRYGDEALFIVNKIIELFESGFEVYEKSVNGMRSVRFSDIAVISRTNKSVKRITETLSDFGLPVAAISNELLFSRYEVLTVLDFLRIIDNPRQDYPLVAVLRSEYYGFTDDMLAQLKVVSPYSDSFYDAVCKAAEADQEYGALRLEIKQKANTFLSDLGFFRQLSRVETLSRLTWLVINHNGFYEINGTEGKGNLRLFLEFTYPYDSGEKAGLYNFVNYINSVLDTDKRGGFEAFAEAPENEDKIRVMTIHKSKGLEFPVLFIYSAADTVKSAGDAVFFDEKLGPGFDFITEATSDDAPKTVRNSPAFCALRDSDGKSKLAEDQRMLYVAMTRAREKLYITATAGKDMFELFSLYSDGLIAPVSSKLAARMATSYLEMLMQAVFKKSSTDSWCTFRITDFYDGLAEGEAERRIKAITSNRADITDSVGCNIIKDAAENGSKELSDAVAGASAEASAAGALEELFKSFDDGRLPVKLSVSSVKRIAEGEDGELGGVSGRKVQLLPLRLRSEECGSLEEREKLSPAQLGTLTHKCLQLMLKERKKWPLSSDSSEIQLYTESFLEGLLQGGIISRNEFEQAERKLLSGFLCSDRARRIQDAEFVCAETAFTFLTDISKYLPQHGGERGEPVKIALQGVIDLYYKHGDEIVLVDFKTDRINDENEKELREKYSVQLSCYKDALSGITGMSVKESVLMFLRTGQEFIFN